MGDFRMVEISYCRAFRTLKLRNFPSTIGSMSLYYNYTELYEIFKWVVHTKICTNENYPLYGIDVLLFD